MRIANDPVLSQEWDDETDINNYTIRSAYRAQWKCPNGHVYVLAIRQRSNGSGCKECEKIPVAAPELLKFWKDEKNPSDFKPTHNVSVDWGCDNGHTWRRRIKAFYDDPVCHECLGKKYMKKMPATAISLASYAPELVAEWRDRRSADNVGHQSQYVADWECQNGHKYSMSVHSRSIMGVGCQACKKVPDELSRYWADERPMGDFYRGSTELAKWRCENGHTWWQPIRNFVRKPSCNVCSNKKIISGVNDALTTHGKVPGVEKKLLSTVSYGSAKEIGVNCKCHGTYNTQVRFAVAGAGCPKCAKRRSAAEKEVAEHIGIGRHNDRSLGIELDIFIPEKNIAVEYNGLYWHTEDKVGKNYHRDKWQVCADNGVQLITIWEDDWKFRREVVEKMLTAKIFGRKTIGARKTSIRPITYRQSKEFLDDWHIQGSAKGTHYLGLFVDELVAVDVFKTTAGVTSLERYASSVGVQGGLDKMIKHLDPESLVTFADLTVSDGNLYANWRFDRFLKPDYRYVVNGRREHKFNYRLNRFRTDPNLLWEPGLSESELAKLNKIDRVYDCGKARYTHKP